MPPSISPSGIDFKPSLRFAFNGKENDNEVKGIGNQQDYGFRIYDTRIAKFLSVDPLTKDYPWYTPYQFAGNKPIWAVDLDGKEEFFATDYFDVNGVLYKTVITLASDRGIKEDVHTVYRSSVYTNVSTDQNGNATTTFVKFYNGAKSAQNVGGDAFATNTEYEKALGRNANATPKITRYTGTFPISINGGAIQAADGEGYTPITLHVNHGESKSPEARYVKIFYLPGSNRPYQARLNPSDQNNDISLDATIDPTRYNGIVPTQSANIPLRTNAVPSNSGFENTQTVKAQGGDGDGL